MAYVPDQAVDRTECADPTTPAPHGGPDSANLIVNGDFETGQLSPWFQAFALSWQIVGGVLEFTKPDNNPPSGVIGQTTGQAMVEGERLTATFQLGNSSAVRKRVTILLNDASFSDLTACTFWLAAGQPLSTYVYRTVTKKPWPNAMLHVYPATAGFSWFQLDNVTLQRTPNANIVGTECIDPGPGGEAIGEEARNAPVVTQNEGQAAAAAAIAASYAGVAVMSESTQAVSGAPLEIIAPQAGIHVLSLADAIDLRDATPAFVAFDSWLASGTSRGAVQVSIDGETWVTVRDVAPSDDWTSIGVDLSLFAGEIVRVRFVLDARDKPEAEEPAWRIRNFQVVR